MKSPGSPAWRKAGRPAKGDMPKKETPAEDIQAEIDMALELHGKTAEELKRIAECDALRALIAQARRPTRHATAVVSAAGKLLEFSSAKPAAVTQLTGANGGPVESKHTICFVDPKVQE